MQNFRWGVTAAVSAIFISVALGILFDVNILPLFLRAIVFGVVFFGFGFGLRFVLNSFFPELLYASESDAVEAEQPGARVDITIDSTGEYAVPELFKYTDPQELGNIEDLISGVFRSGYGEEERKQGENQAFGSGGTRESVDAEPETGYNDIGFFQEMEAQIPEAEPAGQGFQPMPGFDFGKQNQASPFNGDDFQDVSVFEKPASAAPVEKPAAFQPHFSPSFGDDSGLGGLPDLDMMARAFSSAYGSSPEPSQISTVSASPPVLMPEEEEIGPDRSQYKGNKPQAMEGDFQAKDIARGLSTLLSKDK